jgi:Ca2+-binding EF-hand superfamily protein
MTYFLKVSFTKRESLIIKGVVNEDTFKHIYGQFFPFADTSTYAHLIFGTFDLRSSGCVTFEDFLVCLSTLCRGSIEDRLRWIFTLYDTKKSGKLTRDVSHNHSKINKN